MSTCLLWTTWTLGGVRLWGQIGTLVFSIASLVIAVWPSWDNRWTGVKALLKFIPFWIGMFVAAYIVVQALNSSWAFVPGADGRLQAVAVDHIKWLPSGVDTPWRMMSPWRMLLIFVPCWLVTSALWCGCRRPKAMRILLWTMAINGAAFATIGILQTITHSQKMLWIFDKPVRNQQFWGMIVNPNHASAFMNLGLVAALALFLYYTGRRGRDFTKGGAYLMLIPLSAIMGVGVFQSMSRAGIVVSVLVAIAFMLVLIWRLFRFLRNGGSKTLLAVFCTVVLFLFGVALAGMRSAVDAATLKHEIGSIMSVANDPEDDTRYFINEASCDLFQMHPAYGWGAGCYRYFINIAQRKYDLLMRRGKPVRIIYAHNEYMNSLCDLGIVGTIPILVGIIGLPVFVFFYRKKGVDGAYLFGVAGLCAIMLHAAIEFFMQHPLVALQFAILLAAITRMACLTHNKIQAIESESR